jgi:hypothetical protein
MLRDDLTFVKGNHIWQFGGQFQNNYNFHTRTDNGSTINNQIVYQIAGNQVNYTGFFPSTVTSATNQAIYTNIASSILGLVGLTQVIYTRTGSTLQIQPIGTRAAEQSTIKYYSGYVADTWRMKPSITLTYGVSYMYETPPVEKNGAQVELVYSDGSLGSHGFVSGKTKGGSFGRARVPDLVTYLRHRSDSRF